MNRDHLPVLMEALHTYAENESFPDEKTVVIWDMLCELEDTYNVNSRDYYWGHKREEKLRRERERYRAKQAARENAENCPDPQRHRDGVAAK